MGYIFTFTCYYAFNHIYRSIRIKSERGFCLGWWIVRILSVFLHCCFWRHTTAKCPIFPQWWHLAHIAAPVYVRPCHRPHRKQWLFFSFDCWCLSGCCCGRCGLCCHWYRFCFVLISSSWNGVWLLICNATSSEWRTILMAWSRVSSVFICRSFDRSLSLIPLTSLSWIWSFLTAAA